LRGAREHKILKAIIGREGWKALKSIKGKSKCIKSVGIEIVYQGYG